MQENSDISRSLLAYSEQSSKAFFAYQVEAKQFIYLNPAFSSIWRTTVENIQSKPEVLLETIHPEDREYLRNTYNKLLQGVSKKEIEFRIQFNGDETRWLCLSDPIVIEEQENQHLLVGMLDDITEAKEKYGLMEKFASKKNSVLEILAHDLAGPLTNIQSITTLLADDVKELNKPGLNKLVGMIAQTSQRSIKLIREFVKHEFLTSANSSYSKKRVNFVERVMDSMEEYKNSEVAIAKIFKFTSSHEEIFIEVDDYKLMQAINNLISNAIKFTPDGGTISVHLEDKDAKIRIVVADNGIGIPEKYQAGIFERFPKGRRPGLKGEPSTGLGMSIIKTIVEWHNGTIWFDSQEGKGSTFYIEVPKE